jgi:hypothetical protein
MSIIWELPGTETSLLVLSKSPPVGGNVYTVSYLQLLTVLRYVIINLHVWLAYKSDAILWYISTKMYNQIG